MWFDGPIANAVATAKSQKRLLIVFVNGEDEVSNRVSNFWNNNDIQNIIAENSCIALKLPAGSEAAKQFGQIYPVVSIPISFFIMPNGGVPLEVLVQYESLDDFKEKLVKTIQAFKSALNSETQKKSPTQAPAIATATNENATVSQSPADATTASGQTDNQQDSSNNLQDRVDKAQALIRERQEQKAREAEENARAEEIKRRQQGQEFQRAQERLKEQEALKNAQEQKKAKQEDKEHLKKLRDQIAADRAEKASKFSNVQSEQKRVVEEKKQQKVEMDERQRQEEEERRKRFALLQFRLPDGSAIRNQFEGAAMFSAAEQWLAQEIHSTESSFQLIQMFPRREFTAQDRSRSFVDLGLTPSAVLLVLPISTGGQSYNGPRQPSPPSTITWLWDMITSPVRYVFNFIYMFVFGTGAAPRPISDSGGPPTNANNPAGLNQQPRTGVDNRGGPSTSAAGTGSGNVVRFHNAQDSDKKGPDDNATWNGNSTQML